MKILTASQSKGLDAHAIKHEPISSLDLMERASSIFSKEITKKWDTGSRVKVFAGPGNNGGDALAVARILACEGYDVAVFLFNTGDSLSPDCQSNKERLNELLAERREKGHGNLEITEVTSSFTPPKLTKDDLVIDGLFGTGLSRPLNGGFASVVKYINASPATVVAIDVPSGLMTEDNTYNVMNHIVHADYTFTFQFPKLAFLFPENEQYVGEWTVLDIGIKDPGNELTQTPYYLTDRLDIRSMLKRRSRFAHKGTVGHGVLIAGKRGMAGASILSARACLRTGIGKLTVHTPGSNVEILQTTVPEAIIDADTDQNCFSQSFDTQDYDALAIGPGIGTDSYTIQAFIEQVSMSKCPMVIDADALNILGSHRGWINQLPRRCILTPHKKELFGLISSSRNSYEELEMTRELCVRQQIYIIIKRAFSAIVTPEGNVFFNPTGNPGMATAGSGDVLTGIILSLLAQGYNSEQAARIGAYLHGLAGDIAADEYCIESVIASDIVDNIAKAYRSIKKD